jgi:hypothetical protein
VFGCARCRITGRKVRRLGARAVGYCNRDARVCSLGPSRSAARACAASIEAIVGASCTSGVLFEGRATPHGMCR